MGRDVQQALDEAARLAQRIYPQLLEAGGLAAALRSAAVSAGIPASVDVTAGSTYAPEILRTVYLCWRRGARARPRRCTRDGNRGRGEGSARRSNSRMAGGEWTGLEGLRDRVEALGGRLTVESDPGRGTYVSGSLPVSS